VTDHPLKTWPEYFQAIVEGRKPFEYRFNDRDPPFREGDTLHLREWVPPPADFVPADEDDVGGYYTGRELRKRVTYILDDRLGPTMKAGFVVMGLGPLHVGPDIEPSPWVPMSDPRDIKVVGKNLEEFGEGVVALARALIQGIDGTEPSTGKPNRQWVQEELSDALATSRMTVEHFGLDRPAMVERAERKYDFLGRWLGMLSR
jgi:hypothetical protein